MKTLKSFMLLVGILLGSTVFYSCLDDDGYSPDKYSFGIATIKPLGNNNYYLQWDDSTTLWPASGVTPDFGVDKERRAFINFTLLGDSISSGIPGYDYIIRVNKIDSVLTKSIVADLGEKNDEYYGNDPIWMKSVWIEDGYINFQFESYFDGHTKHFLNLVKMNNTGTYELEFRHNAYGNIDSSIRPSAGLVSFKLDKLEGKTVKLKIKYKSFVSNDYNTVELDYKSKDTEDTEE